jgi:hypothetical protein
MCEALGSILSTTKTIREEGREGRKKKEGRKEGRVTLYSLIKLR